MRKPHSLFRLIPLLLAGAALAACDQPRPDLPTGARAEVGGAVAPLIMAGPDSVPGRYIVVLHGGEQSSAAAVARQVTSTHGARVHHTYTSALDGFAATLTPAAVEALRRNPQVKYVAQDVMTYPDQVTQPTATWGLDRIDQRALPLNTTYVYSRTGAGVRVYVIDSGIRTAHNEFGGRASVGTDFVGDGQNGQDCNGHGTHVSGTIAGATYGVAKAANVIAVRVFPCAGGTTTSTVIAAVDWIRLNAVKPAVVNYSGGGAFNTAHNAAVQALVASGVTYVTSAGNDGFDACNKSPASTPEALTVASSEINDARSSFSNWGTCVDLFAPGGSITSAWWNSNTATNTISGTSMASPHVAGVAALYLQGSPTATPATVGAQILASTTPSRVTNIGTGSPNRLLFSLLTAPPPAPAFGLNPSALSFTFVRTVNGAAVQADAAAAEAPRQEFTATGEGTPKTAPDGLGQGHEATASSLVLTGRALLSNTGTAALVWTSTSNRPWLTADPTDGTLNPTHTAYVNATVNAAGLSTGTHTGAVTVNGPAGAQAGVDVTVNVTDALSLVVGTPRTGQSGTLSSLKYYAVNVPAGATSLTIGTSGGTGDVDLYVRYGNVPTMSAFDCRPFMGGNVETCQVNAPLPGTYYVMLHGWSAYSGVTLAATSGGTPASPVNLTARPTSLAAIHLTWGDGSVNETGFTVSRRALQLPSNVWTAWADVGSPGPNATTFTNTGLVAGTLYQFRVRACNAAGCSAWLTGGGVTIPTEAPSPPFNLVATATSGTTATVTWTDGSGNETSFSMMRALRNVDGTWGAYAAVASPSTDAVAFNNAGLLPGRQYRYQLQACNPAGCSAWTVSNIVVMPSVPPPPPAITATTLSGSSIRVQWTDGSANETSFVLQRATVTGGNVVGNFALVSVLSPNLVLYNNTGMTAGTYQYRIRACNLAGCSAWATTANVVIPPVPTAPASASAVALSATSVRLTWPDAGSVETSYQVYRALRNLDGTWPAFTAFTTLPANTVLYNNLSLLSGRAYRYQVRACNLSGCSGFATSNIVSTVAP